MHRKTSDFLSHRSTWRRVGGGVVLIYLLMATHLAPALTALLALADRSHHVAVQQTARGVDVVLRHGCIDSPTHRHGMVARALNLIAQRPPTGGHPDHVIPFAESIGSALAPAAALDPVPDSPSSQPFPPPERLEWALPLAAPAPHSGAPPGAGVCPLRVRSTVLLI